jgi:methyl-accepting chemotaxis protein
MLAVAKSPFKGLGRGSADAGLVGIVNAINRVQAVIEFTMDGKILHANENFLKTLGYSLEEVKGNHHSMFVDAGYRQSPEYRLFWDKLGRGEYDTGQYKRIGKGGREVWIQASYNPVFDANGKPVKVIKFATDITQQKLQSADYEGQLAAIGKAQAVIEFTLDGKVLNANSNFLNVLGYTLAKSRGITTRCSSSPATGRVLNIGCSGKSSAAASMMPASTSASARAAPKSGFKQATIRSWMPQAVVESAKSNDLTDRVPLEGKTGEIGALCSGVNGLIDTMMSVVVKIRASSREVSSASAEIAASTTDLSQRTEEQAASLEETSASMEEMSATVKKNADNAQQANQSAGATRDVADRGGQVVAKAVEAMARIEESSRKISDIIGVIDEIARQTNLLALNAAVEAARAGEAGRGFAVVASEVRSLAQRSSQAAKDIKDLITNSNSQVKDGVDLVNKAGTALNEIVESIKKVAVVISDIAAASAEQATGIEQVNKALTQMDEVTQQNSALVEENAATAKTLEQQSKAMSDEVGVFVVDEGEVERPAAAPKRPVAAAARPAKAAAPKRAAGLNGGGPVGRMQSALATAVRSDPDWQEF